MKGLALQRDAEQFWTLLGGHAGAGGFYALGQRMKAALQRRPYQAEHTSTVKTAQPVGEERA